MGFLEQGYAEMAIQGHIGQLQGRLNEADTQLAKANADIDQLLFDKAYILAQRAAADAVLFGYVGAEHPIWDKALRERLGHAGVTAWNATTSWEAVKEAGRSFSLPAGPDIHKDCASREKAEAFELRTGVLQGLYSKQLKEIESLTMSLAHHMAQAAAFRQQLTEADPTNPLVIDGSLRQRVADRAYEELTATNFKDWSVVKQVGSTFVSSAERARSATSPAAMQAFDRDTDDHQDPPWLDEHLRELDLQMGAGPVVPAAADAPVTPADN